MSSLRSSLRSMLRWRGDFGRDRQDLERDVAVDETRDVDLAAIRRARAGPGPTAANRRAGRPPTAAGGARVHGPRRGRAGSARSCTGEPRSARPAVGPRGGRRRRRPPRPHRRRRRGGRPSRRQRPRLGRRSGCRRRPGHEWRSDLVEEGQRAGVALERDRGRSRAARPPPRVRRRRPGAARRSPRCRGAGRPSAA